MLDPRPIAHRSRIAVDRQGITLTGWWAVALITFSASSLLGAIPPLRIVAACLAAALVGGLVTAQLRNNTTPAQDMDR